MVLAKVQTKRKSDLSQDLTAQLRLLAKTFDLAKLDLTQCVYRFSVLNVTLRKH